MIYSITVTVPKSTTAIAPSRSELSITQGLIYYVELYFPPGPSGLVGVRVFDGAYQLFPASTTEYMIGDNLLLRYDELYMKEQPPFELIVECYNSDDSYDHTIRFAVGLASKDEYIARFIPTRATDQIGSILSAVSGQQSSQREKTISELAERFAREKK